MMLRTGTIHTLVFLLGLVAVMAAATGRSQAQTETMTSPTIAVIDMQAVRRQSQAVQSIEQQIKNRKSTYQKELSQEEKKIREENQSLSKQRTLLSQEAFENKRKELRKKLGSLKRDIQTQKKNLDKSYSQAMRKVQKKLIEIIENIAKERNLDMIVNKAAIALVRPEMEVTGTVLKRLNEQLSSVDVPNAEQQ